MQIFIHLDGDDKLLQKLDSINKYLTSGRLRRIFEDFKNKLVTLAKKNAPVKTGKLRDNIFSMIRNWGSDAPSIEVRIKSNIKYGNAVHDGSPRHPITAKNASTLSWVDDSPSGIGGTRLDWPSYVAPPSGYYRHIPKSVNHPGQKENPFIEKAGNEIQPRLLMAILKDLNQVIRERGNK